MSGMDWIKLNTSWVDNPRLVKQPEYIQARFFKLYLLAGECDAGGLITYSLDEICMKLRITMKELKATIEVLNKTNPVLFCNNGNGPEIPIFKHEQVSKKDREKKKKDNAKRQRTWRNKHSDKRISNTLLTQQSQSQSQSQSTESESEDSEESQSVVQPATDADLSPKDQKKDICNMAGINPKYSRRIIENDQISVITLLAELARNYAREGKGKGQARNPAACTGMNLSAEPIQIVPDFWKYRSNLEEHLPDEIKKKFGIVIQRQEDGSKESNRLATRIEHHGKAVEDAVENFKGRKAK